MASNKIFTDTKNASYNSKNTKIDVSIDTFLTHQQGIQGSTGSAFHKGPIGSQDGSVQGFYSANGKYDTLSYDVWFDNEMNGRSWALQQQYQKINPVYESQIQGLQKIINELKFSNQKLENSTKILEEKNSYLLNKNIKIEEILGECLKLIDKFVEKNKFVVSLISNIKTLLIEEEEKEND